MGGKFNVPVRRVDILFFSFSRAAQFQKFRELKVHAFLQASFGQIESNSCALSC